MSQFILKTVQSGAIVLFVCFWFVERRSHDVIQAGLEFTVMAQDGLLTHGDPPA